MTTDHDHDTDLQRAIDTAAQELARRLRPWVAGMADLDAFAVRFIQDMHGQGWRPIPRPAAITSDTRPGDYARGAALARAAKELGPDAANEALRIRAAEIAANGIPA